MSTSATAIEGKPDFVPSALEDIALEYADRWISCCHKFVNWHRENFLKREPAVKDRRALDRVLPWLLRSTRIIQGQMLDPQWPHPDLAQEVEAALWQLQQIWEMTHNPMTEDEADALLAAVFPA